MKMEFMEKAMEIAKHSNCSRRSVAVVAVKEEQIILTAYNTTIIPQSSCMSVHTCIRSQAASGERLEYCWAIHAEQSLIIKALEKKLSLRDTFIYCTTQPCSTCCKMLIMAGIAGIYYAESYPTEFTDKIVEEVKLLRPFVFEQIPYDKKRKRTIS